MLAIKGADLDANALRRLFDYLDSIEAFLIDFLPGDLMMKLLSVPVKRLCFFAHAAMDEPGLTEAEIGPKDIFVGAHSQDEFPTKSFCHFFTALFKWVT